VAEVRAVHQIEELRVVGEIDARLGGEAQRIAARFLPRNDQPEQGLRRLLVADEVVVDDERGVEAGAPHVLDLFDHVLRLP
jgi:hypothetical protein